MNIFWGNAEIFSGTPKKGRSKISAKIWPLPRLSSGSASEFGSNIEKEIE